MCDFPDLLQQYANTLPSKQLLFRVSKPCGYSQLIMLPRMDTSNQITVSDLLQTIEQEMGSYTVGKIYFYPKVSTSTSATVSPIYLTHQTAIRDPLAQFALTHLPTAYSIDDCKYAVYQLYVDMNCCDRKCSCNSDFLVPQPPQVMSLSNPADVAMCIHQGWMSEGRIDQEPTREEILSLLYDPEVQPPPPPTSPMTPSLLPDIQPLPPAQPVLQPPPAVTRPMPCSGLVTPWG